MTEEEIDALLAVIEAGGWWGMTLDEFVGLAGRPWRRVDTLQVAGGVL